ncbi:MAG: PLP-dependent aminotransferase family protein [Synergistaceae bacterium]|nr:PLP-dependent aminotransferase family protein [Synergistaceae bacterium]
MNEFSGILSNAARERLGRTEIGEMISLSAKHGAISFGAGEPSPEMFPVEEMSEAIREALREPDVWGYYHDDYGDPSLREWIADRMFRDGLSPSWVSARSILITNGGGEAVNLASGALIDPGAVVLVESPTYTESLLTFRARGAVCVSVPSDDEGIVPEELERIVSYTPARFLYTIPNFQNPSGRTTSAERRVRILDVARRAGIAIVEDDPYHYLSYDGPAPESYLRLAGDDARVIHCSSFSKIVAPGLRVGWMTAPPELEDIFRSLRVSAGLGRPLAIQRGLRRYLDRVDFPGRIERLRSEYRGRRDMMTELCRRYLTPVGVRTNRPGGGFFIWAETPGAREGFSSRDFARRAVERGICVVPGTAFYPSGGGERAFRLSFAKSSGEAMEEGMRRLSRAFADEV